jgi:hypothetical protein
MESEQYPYNQSPSLIRKLCKVLCQVQHLKTQKYPKKCILQT